MMALQHLPEPWEGCALWRIDLGTAPTAADLASLDAQERARAARFVFEHDRRRYQAAHVAMRALLAEAAALGEPSTLRFEHNAFGKPSLADAPDWHFSLSHSGDTALLAIDPAAPVGVDVEVERAMDDVDALANALFTDAERAQLQRTTADVRTRAFLLTWTRKEACLKAVGTGFGTDARQLETACADATGQAWLDDGARGTRPLHLCSGRLGPNLLYSVASTRMQHPRAAAACSAEALA